MILVSGEALIDFFPAAAPAAGSLGFVAMPGGSPFNVAIGLARLGCASGFLAMLSTDAFGRLLEERLAAEGVDRRWLRHSPLPSTLSFVTPGPDGSPDYVFLGEGAADRSLGPQDLPEALGPDVKAIQLGSFALAVEPIAGTLAALVRRESGRRVVALDANIRHRLIDVAQFRPRFEALVAGADLVKASTEDIGHLYGTDDFRAIGAHWRALGASLVLVTDGAAGAHGLCAEGWCQVASPKVTVIDTVGAGDTFQAATLAALDRRGLLDRAALAALPAATLAEIAGFATRAAAITCSRRGPDLPRWDEVA